MFILSYFVQDEKEELQKKYNELENANELMKKDLEELREVCCLNDQFDD